MMTLDSSKSWISQLPSELETFILRPILEETEREGQLRKGGFGWTQQNGTLKEFVPLVVCYALFAYLVIQDFDCYFHSSWLRCVLRSPLTYLVVGPIFAALMFQYVKALIMNLGPKRGWTDIPTPPEPAYRSYFFYKAQKDYECALRQALEGNKNTTKHVFRIILLLVANPAFPITWIPGVPLAIFLGMGYIAAIALYVGIGLLFLIVVLACCLTTITFAYALRLFEYLIMQGRRIRVICPNSGCYQPIALPIYLCSSCQSQHLCLLPGPYGVFRRRCQCGTKISTSFLTGRSKLMSLCPHDSCRKPLPTGIDAIRVVHISLIGGPNAGKTTLLAAVTSELKRCSDDRRFAIQLPQTRQVSFLKVCESLFKSGHFPAKTLENFPDAFVAYLEDVRGNRVGLYIYDSAGEAFKRQDILRAQRFHSVTNSVLFLVDPMTVRRFITDCTNAPTPDGVDPQTLYDAFVETLRESRDSNSRSLDVEFTAVITKADQLGHASADPRHWLKENGQGNLVRSIENDFKEARYLYSSVIPDIQPERVGHGGITQIVDWILDLTELDAKRGQVDKSGPQAENSDDNMKRRM